MKSMRYASCLCLPILTLAACTVGVDYHRPQIAGGDAQWIGPTTAGDVDEKWWRSLGDPALDELVDAAAAQNLDMREAEAMLRESRANRDAAAGRALPILSAAGAVDETQVSANGQLPTGNIPGFDRRFSLFDGGFDASWEIDLWGGTRRAIESAAAREVAAGEHRSNVRLQVIAEVSRTYVALRAAQARLANIRADSAARETIACLVSQRFAAGEASRSDVASSHALAVSSRAGIAGGEADIRDAVYRLALLTGRPPEALLAMLRTAMPLPEPPAIVTTGIRSDLLRRRPDVRGAEADLAAATADIGVETANLFPRFSLIGSLGQQARRAGDLTSSGSTRFQLGPSVSWPIFSAGRIRAQIRAAGARADAAGARYEKAVLSALSDSETALNRYLAAQATRRDREAALIDISQATDFARQRYQAGEDDQLAFLEAQSVYRVVEQQAITARAGELVSYIALAKSLGGGWQAQQSIEQDLPPRR